MSKILVVALALSSSTALAKPKASQQLTLPLPSQGSTVYANIGQGIRLVAEPQTDGWDIAAIDKPSSEFPPNLLYHSKNWHGPYPTQIYAWHLLKGYFPNTRWVCVAGHSIEVELQIRNAKVKPVGGGAEFESGELFIQWFHRPCTRGFGYERLAPNNSFKVDGVPPPP